MANLDDTGDQFPEVYQFEQTDPLLSGPPNEATGAGMDNIPHLQLARRTRWLKTRVDALVDLVVLATTNVAGIVRLSNSLTSDRQDRAATSDAIRRVNNKAEARVPLTRTLTGAGLATGGGALDQDRTITVPKASDQQAIDGVADDVALTPKTGRTMIEQLGSATLTTAGLVKLNDTLTSTSVTEAATANAIRQVNNNANGRVPASRTLTGAGLATGGGALTENRILTVPKASEQQAIDGVADNVALTPKTGRAQFEALLGGAPGLVPPGAVMDFAMQAAPAGWLVCDGSQISRVDFAALFAAIGTTWGAGNGSTTFTLPDFRGEFRRGWDGGRGVDAGRAFGSGQLDALQGHRHHFTDGAGGQLGISTTNTIGSGSTTRFLGPGVSGDVVRAPKTDGANGTPRTGPETRPRNIAVLTCIKA